jgi:hypothetical protein
VLGPDKLLVVLIDVTTWLGDGPTVAATVREHLTAGADHVIAGLGIGGEFTAGVDLLEQLAKPLAAL